MTHTVTLGHCPTSETSPTYIAMNAAAAAPAKPIEWKSGEPSQTKEEHPLDACMSEETATQGSL